MAELFTEEEVKEYLQSEVRAAGGAKEWLKKNKIGLSHPHLLRMIENGEPATDITILSTLGFKEVVMYEAVPPRKRISCV
jgi:hypothetical protein